MTVSDTLIGHDSEFHDFFLIGLALVIDVCLLDGLTHGDEHSGSTELIEMVVDRICSD